MQPRLRENDWLLASDGTKSGMVPANYVRVLGTRKGKPLAVPVQDNNALSTGPEQSVTPQEMQTKTENSPSSNP